jgi:hypothetical protein
MQKTDSINRFYDILQVLENKVGGCRRLSECHGDMNWPQRGVYFFFERGEMRTQGSRMRVVRVGTHALKRDSRTTLWDRLRAHRGTLGGERAGGGNHRGSIFRLHVVTAILKREGLEKQYATWGVGSWAKKKIRKLEYPVEKKVSSYIGLMPFLWLEVDDAPGPQSERAYIERNSINILSNYGKLETESAHTPSDSWLGRCCRNALVQESGLWNVDHVTETYVDPSFLERLENLVQNMSPRVKAHT